MIEKLEQREGEKCNVVMVTTITMVGSSKNGREESASGFFFSSRGFGVCVCLGREEGTFLPGVSPPDDGEDDEQERDNDDRIQHHNDSHGPGGDGAGHTCWLITEHILCGAKGNEHCCYGNSVAMTTV